MAARIAQTFLVFDNFDSLANIDQVFYKMSFNWNLCNIYLMIRLDSWVFERKTPEVK